MARHNKDDRPHPLLHEATWRGVVGVVGVGGSMLGITQFADLPTVVEPVLVSFASGGVLFATRSAAKASEKHVTPTSDPRDDYGNPLVAISPEI